MSRKSTGPSTTGSVHEASRQPDDSWLPAERDYALALADGKLICRNPKGKQLSAVPKWLRATELAERLNALSDWLDEHRQACQRRVEMWMLRSLPVPRAAVTEVWPDPDWRAALQNLVITPADARGKRRSEPLGLLREVHPRKGLGVIDADAETRWIRTAQLTIPHPILIEELRPLREIATDLEFDQSVEQLFRSISPPRPEQADDVRIADFQGGRFAQLNFATSLCRRLGYPVRGGYACAKIWENERPVEARLWVGDEYPELETYTGDLIFVDQEQRPQRLGDLGPVTFSEGLRMAAQIYAKRQVEEDESEEPE